MKVLLLEDDYLYNVTIKEYLENNGYEVDSFDDGLDAIDAIYTNTYSLLLLDIRVPQKDGYEILKEIRENDIQTPVIILTSLTDINNLSIGYELGCSDYIRKPFELKELKYRIEYIVKTHCFKSSKDLVRIDDCFTYNVKMKVLFKEEKEVDLTAQEKEFVSYLIQSMDYFVSLDTLQDIVWEGKEITYADIRMCVKRIREKTDKSFIINKKLVGYKIGKK